MLDTNLFPCYLYSCGSFELQDQVVIRDPMIERAEDYHTIKNLLPGKYYRYFIGFYMDPKLLAPVMLKEDRERHSEMIAKMPDPIAAYERLATTSLMLCHAYHASAAFIVHEDHLSDFNKLVPKVFQENNNFVIDNYAIWEDPDYEPSLKEDGEAYVDSGMLGFYPEFVSYENPNDPEDTSAYDAVMDFLFIGNYIGDDFFVVPTFQGDGTYPIFTHKNKIGENVIVYFVTNDFSNIAKDYHDCEENQRVFQNLGTFDERYPKNRE